MTANPDDHQKQLEAAARAAFELYAERRLTDAEWAAVRARLVEFGKILCTWERKAVDSERR